jgi:hypothetical protein
MATKALTPVAPRARHRYITAESPGRKNCDLRRFLVQEDASAVWEALNALIRPLFPDRPEQLNRLSQDFFLCLLTSDRFPAYVSDLYSDEEIALDLLTLLHDQGRSR